MHETASSQPRVAAITGAGTGIGQVAAVRFASLGWLVVIGGRRVGRLEEKEMIDEAGGTCLAHELDVGDGASVERFFDASEAAFGTVTAAINNAATARYGPLQDFSPDEIALEVGTKLTGSLLMAARGIRGMLRAGVGGDIIFVTSAAAVWPWIEHLPYAAANAGAEHAARISCDSSWRVRAYARASCGSARPWAPNSRIEGWRSASCHTTCGFAVASFDITG